ncbi:enhancer of mRNA-decapping protein 4 homolog isoform X1 [Anopheles ziemanni]|uniref:enhancer of mRNA-decapping protein 4 homolog isoform X1 n=1 Tax=Anopheles coustani TaxID=139045 RepID=UPI002659E58B|nr:enhancer of mRNA-decapping protein 4 homolog isoform X1 [Anopheles coustani]XP_058126557.1 enhancer of mRNA-decapping protein 4 homolog isoform X1 [Anopheles coustani]XP_058168639.1 enhancer of mRNA-decapping protein 4 homolog isoform X1 [Anopheles ziemanni]XP_058168640.1 enhancer of mRNA-decapping protein 4 homolog isoform X1 [Anopheles ziemanni]
MESDSTAMSGNKIFRFTSEENQHSFKASDKNITVMCSGGAHDRGSSKIKLDNVVNYKWEVKHYPGRLIACHKEGQLLAYALTVVKLQKPEGMVRVASLQLSQRALIRGLSEMLDIQFAHTTHPDYLLGIIERSNLQVYQVLINGTELTTSLKVKIVDPLEGHVPEYDRINWCPYLRENDYEIDDFASQLLVWTRGSTFQCYSISKLSKTYGESVNLKAVDIDEGGFKASDGDATITGSVYSADGTTLALSSMDGMIRFYQVYQHANNCTPRRLHQWKPHGGRSVSSFFFLDNYTETVDNDKVLWKNVITCADNNTEIRVWCCESWECLQTIRLESPMVQPLNFKAEIDLSSSFLVLSDMNTRQIYVLQIRKGQSSSSSALPSPASSSARDQASGEPQWKSRTASLARGKVNRRVDQSSIKPYIVSIAEYPISTMILGFGILWARVGNCFQREQDDEDEDQSLPSCIVIRMFLVQPSSMQDCTLVYDPVDESECEPLAIDAGDDVNTNDCEVEDGNEMQSPQSSGSSVSSSSSAASSSAETTDNNLSHPPSEASDQSVERESKVVLTAMSAPKASAEESSDGSGSNAGSRKDDEEEEGSPGPATNLLMLKMAEAAQKLNDKNKPASGSPPDANTSASGGINSGPTTPASTTAKVNLMTPDSFSTPSGRGSRSANDSGSNVWPPQKDVRIINLSEVPYPEVETLMSQLDTRRRGRGRGARASKIASTETAATIGTSSRKNDSSASSTASANGASVCSSRDGSSGEGEGAGGNNTSVASIAGSERIANITDDPDEEDDQIREEQQEEDGENRAVGGEDDPRVVTAKRKEKSAARRLAAGLGNGDGDAGSTESPKNTYRSVRNVTSTSTVLSVEHFTKILTLDEAEPRTAREKNKSDETVNPNVLNTLLMLANATKQRQPAQKVVEMVSSSVTLKGTTVSGAPQARPANDMQAFVNMMNSLTLNKEAVMSSGKLPESSNGPLDGAEGGIPPEIPPMPSADMLASGGSSPSREVQEIMSTKGSGLNLMVDDLLHFVYTPGQRKPSALDDEEEEEVEEAGVDVDDGGNAGGGGQGVTTHTVSDSRYAEEEGVVRVASNGPQEEKLEPSDNNEKLGDGEEIGNKILVTSEGATSSTVDIDGLQNASAVPTIDGESKKPTVAPFWPSVPLATTATVSDSSKQTLEALTDKMDRMMELLLAQSCRMEEMNGQLEAMKKAKNDEHRRYSTLINRFQQTIPKTIETQINNCLVQHTVRLEHTIQSCFGKQQALLTEALKNSIVQALLAQLPEQLSVHLVRDLHLKILVPIGGKLDVVQRGLTDEIAHRLATLEDPLKNAITRTLRAEQFHNAIAINVKRDLKQQFDEAYNDSLRNTVIPRYEKVHQELFRQANLCFTEGVKELMRKIDEHIGRVAQTHERTNEVADLLRKIPDEIAVKGERVTSNTLRVIREHLEKDIKGLHTPLMKTIRENIRQEIEKGFEAQASCLEDSVLSVVRSQAQTPAPTGIEVQDQIKKYLKADQINLAFHMALASNELSVVEFLLERADPKKVFDPCPLEQTVLLSLIQQISADMSNHNELKHKYLDDAIVSLNLDDPVTQEHSPKVMQELIANCQTFITANPLNPLCGKLKMLMFAAKYISGEQI